MHALPLSPRIRGVKYLGALPVLAGLVPHPSRCAPARRTRVEIGLLEVNSAVAARDPGLVGCFRERRPGQREISSRNRARLDPRAAGRNRDRAAEAIAVRKTLQDLGTGRAEVAMAGRVLGEWRRRERRRLVWKPGGAVDELRPFVWP